MYRWQCQFFFQFNTLDLVKSLYSDGSDIAVFLLKGDVNSNQPTNRILSQNTVGWLVGVDCSCLWIKAAC